MCFRTPRVEVMAPRIALFGGGPRLGVSVRMDRDAMAADGPEGAEVTEVLEGSPADEAGLRPGDIITHLDGQSLTEPLDGERERELAPHAPAPAQRLLALARELDEGEEVEIRYLRDGSARSAVVEPRQLARRRAWAGADPVRSLASGRAFQAPGARFLVGYGFGRGLELVALNPRLGSYFGVEEGVLVTDVAESDTLGLEPGDVVVAVGGRAVETPGRLRRILASYGPDERIELTVVRDGEERTVTAPGGE